MTADWGARVLSPGELFPLLVVSIAATKSQWTINGVLGNLLSTQTNCPISRLHVQMLAANCPYNWTRVLLRAWIMDAGMSGHIGNRRTTRCPVMLLASAPANDGGTFPGYD